MKKILFVTLDKIDSGKSHTTRLSLEFQLLSKNNEVHIIVLNNKYNESETGNIKFYPISFDGWNVEYIDELYNFLYKNIYAIKPDLVILSIEIWDLIKILYNILLIQKYLLLLFLMLCLFYVLH